MAAKKQKSTEEDNSIVEIKYFLSDLPSSQHRAGLAGLVRMIQWIKCQQPAYPGVCECIDLGPNGCTFRFDRIGLKSLFDETYAATEGTVELKVSYKDKKPINTIVKSETKKNKNGEDETKEITYYVYPKIIPKAGLLSDIDVGEKPYLKLWRDMMWTIPHGIPTTRLVFENRAKGLECKDWSDMWEVLKKPNQIIGQSSSFFLGQMAETKERLSIKDEAKNQLLLRFWPYVTQIYVPQMMVRDKGDTYKSEFVKNAYVIVVPDVSCLDDFVWDLPNITKHNLVDGKIPLQGYLPRDIVVDLPAESALDMAIRLKEYTAIKTKNWSDLVLGFDVFYASKDGNSIKIKNILRVDPSEDILNKYSFFRSIGLWDVLFRQQYLRNLMNGSLWQNGFTKMFETNSYKATIGSNSFCHDVSKIFEIKEKEMIEQTEVVPEGFVKKLIKGFVFGKMESKHQMVWSELKTEDEKNKYKEKKEKIIKKTYLAVRSRNGEDFAKYFMSSIVGPNIYISEDQHDWLEKSLNNPQLRQRTLYSLKELVLLALCSI
jgi:CRISPR-associated protein Cmx8